LIPMIIHTSDRVPLPKYMELSLEKRQSHINSDSPCLELGCNSKDSRALLAIFLNTTAEKMGTKGMLLHTCNNPKCSNPEHLYWGTAKENLADRHRDYPNLMKENARRKKEKWGDDYFKVMGALGKSET